jgi:hypothetical protein
MQKKNVCIVGSGIGGIIAAATLKAKGHNVIVFESENRIGGKCCTETYEGEYYEMGACSVSPAFKTVIKFARKTGSRLRVRAPFKVILDDNKQHSFRSVYWPLSKTLCILREMAVYIYHAYRFARLYDKPVTYEKFPGEYEVSFAEFCSAHNLKYIPGWFDLPVVSFGYGGLDVIKTWYIFAYINIVNFIGTGILLVFFGNTPVRGMAKGYGNLVQKISGDIDVKTGALVKNIERDQSGVKVTVTYTDDPAKNEEFKFDSIVIAAPLSDMKEYMKFSEQEKIIHNATTLNSYSIVSCRIKNFPFYCSLIKYNATHERRGHVALIEKTLKGKGSDLCVCYIPEDSFNLRAEDVNLVFEELRKDLEAMGYTITMDDVLKIKPWNNYFPHFEHSSFYKMLNNLQGVDNTYYVGALPKFELAELVAAEAEALMDRSFEGKRPRELFTTIKNWWYYYFRSLPY